MISSITSSIPAFPSQTLTSSPKPSVAKTQTPDKARQIKSTTTTAPLTLPSPESLAQAIDNTSTQTLQGNHGKIQHFLKRQGSSLDLFKDFTQKGLKHEDLDLLPDVPVDQRSEFSRTLDHDMREVLQGFKLMSHEDLNAKKAAAYQHPEALADKPKAIASGYYGSDQHKQYGALVSQLTAGILSPEEAMAMNPSGGLPGPGLKEVPLLGRIDAVARHAMRHDATGFLLTRFGVGPGYGTPTSPIGLDKDNPLAGQWLGVLREAVGTASVMPDTSHVGAPVEWT